MAGFIAGSMSLGRLYRSFVVRDGVPAALSAPGRVVTSLPRVLETLRHGGAPAPAGSGELPGGGGRPRLARPADRRGPGEPVPRGAAPTRHEPRRTSCSGRTTWPRWRCTGPRGSRRRTPSRCTREPARSSCNAASRLTPHRRRERSGDAAAGHRRGCVRGRARAHPGGDGGGDAHRCRGPPGAVEAPARRRALSGRGGRVRGAPWWERPSAGPRSSRPWPAPLVLGVLDDRFDLRPWLRLLGQLSVGAAVATVAPTRLGGFGGAVAVGAVTVVLMNGVNFLDGLDALAGWRGGRGVHRVRGRAPPRRAQSRRGVGGGAGRLPRLQPPPGKGVPGRRRRVSARRHPRPVAGGGVVPGRAVPGQYRERDPDSGPLRRGGVRRRPPIARPPRHHPAAIVGIPTTWRWRAGGRARSPPAATSAPRWRWARSPWAWPRCTARPGRSSPWRRSPSSLVVLGGACGALSPEVTAR